MRTFITKNGGEYQVWLHTPALLSLEEAREIFHELGTVLLRTLDISNPLAEGEIWPEPPTREARRAAPSFTSKRPPALEELA